MELMVAHSEEIQSFLCMY